MHKSCTYLVLSTGLFSPWHSLIYILTWKMAIIPHFSRACNCFGFELHVPRFNFVQSKQKVTHYLKMVTRKWEMHYVCVLLWLQFMFKSRFSFLSFFFFVIWLTFRFFFLSRSIFTCICSSFLQGTRTTIGGSERTNETGTKFKRDDWLFIMQ